MSRNAGAQHLFGYTEAEAIRHPITILIPPELRDEENTILEKLRAGGRIEHYETTRVTKVGRKVDVTLIISPIKDSIGKLVGFCKLAHDITERKRVEHVLHETNRALETQTAVLRSQEVLLKIFVKNVPAGLAMFDREMRYLQVSERWCADYGVDASQVMGHSHYELFPDIPNRSKDCTVVVLPEKSYEQTKTAGIVKTELRGFVGRFPLEDTQRDRGRDSDLRQGYFSTQTNG